MDVYLIPGLGADKRMYIPQLRVLPQAKVLEHFVPAPGSTLADYARQMAEGIDTTRPFALVGTSLGGMISVEMTRILNPQKVVLIATIKNRNEMPVFMRAMKYLKLHRTISGDGFKRFNKLAAKRLDGRNDTEAAALIMEMMNDIPAGFIEWAVDAVVKWSPPASHRADMVHIHGTSDQLFPHSRISNALLVEGGTHIMNITKAAEVNKLILNAINS
jgi:pimeloyl-ACP methyl ester carboxylesterase